MCTMTWCRDKEHYEVFFNRDELKKRSHALAPRIAKTKKNTTYLSPIDTQGGGTWMLVNEHGLCLCLLNRWHQQALTSGKYNSRGKLLISLADATDSLQALQLLRSTPYEKVKPFTVVALDENAEHAIAWDGAKLFEIDARQPQTSSSYKFDKVSKKRIKKYDELSDYKPKSLLAYHVSSERKSACSVRMNRLDAQTWSRSHLKVYKQRIEWQYIEEAPNLDGDGTLHESILKR